MLNANSELKKIFPGLFHLVELFLVIPDCYIATSIKDFLDEVESIKPTPLYRPPFCLINFSNVNLDYFYRESSREMIGYRVYDLTEEIGVNFGTEHSIPSHSSAFRENVEEGRHYELIIRYDPRFEVAHLYKARKFGPPQRKRENKRLSDLVLTPT